MKQDFKVICMLLASAGSSNATKLTANTMFGNWDGFKTPETKTPCATSNIFGEQPS